MSQAIAERCRAKAAEYLTTAKGYNCRHNAELRAGLVKGAAVLNMVAGWLDEEAAAVATTSAKESLAGMYAERVRAHAQERANADSLVTEIGKVGDAIQPKPGRRRKQQDDTEE